MNGLLASLRLPDVLRVLLTGAMPAPSTAAELLVPFGAAAHLAPAPRALISPAPANLAPTSPTSAADIPFDDAPVATLLPAPAVEPSVRVAAAHLVDPVGLRVVPFRPTSRWPLRRPSARIYDPFRGFPMRSAHLADLLNARPSKR